MVQFEGKYQHEKSQNFDEFLKALGVPLVPRKVVANSSPVVEVTKDGDTWCIKMSTIIRDIVYKFKPGEPTQTESMGGSAKNVFTIENNTIRQKQESPTFSTEILREFTDENLTMTMTHVESGTVCHRYFKRME